MNIQLCTLTHVNIINRDQAFSGWINRVIAWQKQWTVENNYRSVPILDGDWTVAAKLWRDQLLALVKQHFSSDVPEWARESFNPALFFEFKFYTSDQVIVGKECFLKSHAYYVALNKIDEAAETFADERDLAKAKAAGELEGQEER